MAGWYRRREREEPRALQALILQVLEDHGEAVAYGRKGGEGRPYVCILHAAPTSALSTVGKCVFAEVRGLKAADRGQTRPDACLGGSSLTETQACPLA